MDGMAAAFFHPCYTIEMKLQLSRLNSSVPNHEKHTRAWAPQKKNLEWNRDPNKLTTNKLSPHEMDYTFDYTGCVIGIQK